VHRPGASDGDALVGASAPHIHRGWAIVGGLVLHALIYYLTPVGTYTATMWLLYLAFVDPDATHRLIDRMSGHRAIPA
jgi:hypothetical protein